MSQMPKSFDSMIESKYLKKDDVDPPVLLTIANFTQENVALKGEPDEHKWIMHFRESGTKPMVLNSTNIQLLKFALGVDSPAEAVDRQIVAYNDPTVSFGGKLTGGVRLRAPKSKAAPVKAQGVDDDDIPFARHGMGAEWRVI